MLIQGGQGRFIDGDSWIRFLNDKYELDGKGLCWTICADHHPCKCRKVLVLQV